MPTRVVVRDPDQLERTENAPSQSSSLTNSQPTNEQQRSLNATAAREHRRAHLSPRTSWFMSPQMKLFKSSMNLREEKVQGDISASPRLLGYALCFVSSLVNLMSSVQLFAKQKTPLKSLAHYGVVTADDTTATEFLSKFKLLGAMVVGSGGALFCIIIVLVHFDTICLPNVWTALFRDGSRGERNLLFFLISFWAVGVYLCTSSYSVGVLQPNAFFSAWFALFSLVDNYDSWRQGAGFTSMLNHFRYHPRKTTYNWCCICFCSFVVAVQITDSYLSPTSNSRSHLTVTMEMFYKAIGISSSTFVVSVAFLYLNHRFVNPQSRVGSMIFDWRILEILCLLSVLGIWSYVILEHTGSDTYVVGLDNLYCGIWGTFLMSLFAIGSWLSDMFPEESEGSDEV